MRTIGFGLALLASAQLTLLSSPAFADDSKSTSASTESTPEHNSSNSSKATTGWIVLGAGGAVTIGGIVLDAIAGGKNQVSGSGGPGDTSTTQNQKTDLLFAGTTMIVAGIVAGIYGGSLVVAANKHNADASRDLPPATGSTDAVTKTAQASFASAPSFMIPVVGAKF
jgi:hypothetical protein